MRGIAAVMAAVLIVLGPCVLASADKVVMKNGDTVSGKILEVKGGELKIEAEHMGTLSIDFDEVSSFSADGPLGVELTGGTRVVGAVDWARDGSASIRAEPGTIEFAAADLISVGPPKIPDPDRPRWHGSVEIGISGESGNSEELDGNLVFKTTRETEDLLLETYASAEYSREDGETTTDRQRFGGRLESMFARTHFWYGALDLERDDFKEINLRTVLTGGVGNYWWREGVNFWKTSIGAGVASDTFSNDQSDTYGIAEAYSGYGKRLSKRAVLTNVTKVIVQLDDIENVRVDNDAAVAVDLNEKGDWKLKLGLRHEYDNGPAEDVDRLDTYYYLSTVKEF
ncbi:MAG: DUF481 domain-containing protein [Planctomycetota bacterium]|jgi:putative salt-induced outer membrane protein YdiY